ncbi:hypothetical protein OCK74_20030 [Chitinophagaceae bacterium LB-8]|uniref:Uncharacterized protein n=1 Tax=Paraflavisolibacter caeni TaxID=2982496 RepID=A0A9X3BII3_9BACT|nr:hypothetical protein [Paraflavisolibacter caeni]MCU7551422.1 hypothetical protein [Paraflavisolibacter caeni]
MSDLNFIVEKLEDMRKDIGISNFSGFLEKTGENVSKIAADRSCHVDIYYHSSSIPSIRKKVEEISKQNGEPGFVYHFISDKKEPLRMFLQMMPAIAVIFLDEDFSQSEKPFQFLRNRVGQYKLLFLINFSGEEKMAKEFSAQIDRSIKLHAISYEAFSSTSLKALISEMVDNNILARLNSFALHNTVRPIVPMLQDIFQTENKIFQTRKLLSGQHGQIIRKEEQMQNNNDFNNNLKTLVQKNMQEMEKSYRSKYEDMNKPNTGRFSQVASDCVQQIKDFQREEIAEKSEKVAISLKKNDTDRILATVGLNLKEEFRKDEAFIHKVFEELVSKVNNQLNEKGISPLKPSELFLPFAEGQRILNSYCYIGKPYAGELVKKGINEYFIALRDYTGLIMVVAGLLAPLNMVATISENAVLKAMSNFIRITTGMITLIMIVYGIYDLRRRIPRKRQEEQDKELNRARETTMQECKRMFNESSRDWQSSVSNWIRDVGQNILVQIEANIKNQGQQKLQQLNIERMQQQRSQQSIDTLHRNFGYAEKSKDALISKFRDSFSNIEKEIKL